MQIILSKMEHQQFMRRCLELAKLGLGNVSPNPMVGAVIVYNNKIVGEGYHQKYGGSHAEVNAINSVSDSTLLKKSTLYVNLEPCSHFGKTPPCADLIIKNKIPYVVIGTIDPYSEVKGKGIEKLLKAGVDVKVGILEKECNELNKRFFTFHNKKRPCIILKWAQSKDGFIGKENIPNYPISNTESKVLSHSWRAEEASILVGTKTAMLDKPSLSTREVKGNSPIRLIIDKELLVNQCYTEEKTIVFNSIKNEVKNNIEFIKIENSSNSILFLNEILNALYNRNIQSVIVEGGAKTLSYFIESNNWDEARVFKSDANIYSGVLAPSFNLSNSAKTKLSNNILYVVKNE